MTEFARRGRVALRDAAGGEMVKTKSQANAQAKDAIFLHSSWRAASTCVWAKFRQRPDTYCYFEPLNEHLFTSVRTKP
jgi:hypothetical protein